jgi:hypothetical protein
MKKKLLFIALAVFLFSCQKKENQSTTTNPPITAPTYEKALSAQDSMTAVNIHQEYTAMSACLDSMLATPHHTVQLHWDSMYHHHDSLYWHHHSEYRHDSATHDDHHHYWTHYDATVDHSHHHHHIYTEHGHEHDSLLIITTGDHVHDNTDHHFHGHDLQDHHLLDSIHHIHELHHP